mmetsp:Transcript_7303/g.10875  ORF Transcript_7303/g.10875 Transcript_7303/m.10875 type:complete len:290 (+) Transcript_7303:13-882(+)
MVMIDLFLDWASGGLANAISSSFLNPMDVSKTRMQAEERLKKCPTRTGMFATIKNTYIEGGIIGLWSPGLTASILREFLYSGPRAGFYVPVRNFFSTQHHIFENDSFACKILAALCTGTFGALIANPIDVIKIRLMVKPQSYPSIGNAFYSIQKDEGIAGLYKGLFPSTLRGAFIAVGEIATYDQTKTILKKNFDLSEGLLLHSMCSLITGFVATTVAAPFDLLKTRSMNLKSSSSSGVLKMINSIIRDEGLLVLFRGWLPAYLRLGPHALICFPILEQIRRAFGLEYI